MEHNGQLEVAKRRLMRLIIDSKAVGAPGPLMSACDMLFEIAMGDEEWSLACECCGDGLHAAKGIDDSEFIGIFSANLARLEEAQAAQSESGTDE